MSGHSKWANIKHKKAKADAQRGAAFTKVARELIVAVKQGGPDPDGNFRLKMAVQAAKAVNMPNDTIQRAIKKAAGDTDSENYEEVVYEGYGPAGIALIVEAMTDNRNRTASDVRYLFSRHGGNLGETGCVSWMFDRKGMITVDSETYSDGEDGMMLIAMDAGAEDLKVYDDYYEMLTSPEELDSVRRAVESAGVEWSEARIVRVPKAAMTLGVKEAASAMRLVDALDEHDDIQHVYTNFDIPDEVLEQLESEES
ncbi:MAG TPA: YebC/PmpR family DNA-binding transcriptional regulator [Firmicutes bacterium]|nr:YebC/PmpR family DNA-binding transcriptional regulator [Bacillota bacterium]